jgi:hypothetical protein
LLSLNAINRRLQEPVAIQHAFKRLISIGATTLKAHRHV